MDMNERLNRKLSLDLLDSSKLTSLPFPPPLKKSKSRFKRFNGNILTPNSTYNLSPRNSPNRQFPNLSGLNSQKTDASIRSESSDENTQMIPSSEFSPRLPNLPQGIPIEDVSFTSIDDLTSFANMTTELEIEDTEDDPIIFVEDYLKSNHQSPLIDRKQSLANFKKRIINNKNNLLNNNKRKISCDSITNKENLEEIFGNIPNKQSLKYCDICDKPLYEISSILNNKRFKKSNQDFKKIDVNLFNEFICSECIELYEEFLQELYEFENVSNVPNYLNDSNFNELKNLKLLKIFKSIQQRTNINKLQNKLIDRLKFINSKSTNFIINDELNWIRSLQQKLRWRWRLNGLLPNLKKNCK